MHNACRFLSGAVRPQRVELLEKAIEELKALPPDRLAATTAYIHQLPVPDLQKRRALLQHADGVLSSEEADKRERALQDCRRLDPGMG
jgi:hypothetical protein